MPLPLHTHVLYDPLTQTSPNGHNSTDISTDRSVELSGKVAVDQVRDGGPRRAIGVELEFCRWAGQPIRPLRFVEAVDKTDTIR